MEIATYDHEMMIKEKMRQKARYAAALRQFFVAMDSDGDGYINHDEFVGALSDQKAKMWLQTLEIQVTEIDVLFHLLANDQGLISFDELLANAIRVRGWARASDQMAILINQRTMIHRVEEMAGALNAIVSRLEKLA